MSRRFIQHPITLELIPRDQYVRPKEAQHFIHGDIQAFKSPVDGSIISDRRHLDEHNRRNGVVNTAEFDGTDAIRKREAFYSGQESRGETRERRQQLYNNWVDLERKHNQH